MKKSKIDQKDSGTTDQGYDESNNPFPYFSNELYRKRRVVIIRSCVI